MPGAGHIQKKILLLLLGGVALGLSGDPKRYFKILGKIKKEWGIINEQQLKRSIQLLYKSKLIKKKRNGDGTMTFVLSEQGKKKALTYNLYKIKIKKPNVWDKKWRMVLFDIPEAHKGKRDILRFHLKKLNFYEFQESVFVHPFDCKNEIEYVIENFQLRKFVRFVVIESMDNELDIKNHFSIS